MAEQSQGDSTDQNSGAQSTGDAGESMTDAANAGGSEPMFTQAQVDHFIKERLNRQRAQFADYDDIKAKAERLDEIEAANKTELEKAQLRADTAERDREELLARTRDAVLRAAVVAEAAKPDRRVADAELVLAALTGPDKDLLAMNDDGTPTDIAAAMDSLLTKRPSLVAVGGGTRGSADLGARGAGPNDGQITREQLKTMPSHEIVKAQNEGRLDHLIKGGSS